MTLKDCYRITLHTIKENKSRSILTVIIAMFLSALIMGMMCLAVSFSKNGNEILYEAYFNGDSIITAEYKNYKQYLVGGQKLFTQEYYDAYEKTLNEHKDVVQFVKYTTNVASGMEYTDQNFPINYGINIIEGRNIAKSDKRNEVIVSQVTYEKSLESGEPLTVGSTHYKDVQYPITLENGRTVTETASMEYVVVGIFETKEEQTVIIDGYKSFLNYGNIIGDVGLAFNVAGDNAYIANSTIYHYVPNGTGSPKKIISNLHSLTNDINEVLPPQMTVQRFFNPGGEPDIIIKYSDGANCNVYDRYSENNAIRYIVIAIAVFFSLILLLMSIGSLANSVIISMDRSKKFIGLLKALGMRRKSLTMIIILESITLISIGVILGYLFLFALYSPLSSLINTIIGSTYSAYVKTTDFVAHMFLPFYVFLGALALFILFTYLFSKGSLRKIAKTDPIAVINEVS